MEILEVFILPKKNGDDETKYAAKLINISANDNNNEQRLMMRESTILADVSHPAIVKFIGINFRHLNDTMKFQPIMITEYEPNSLKGILEKESSGEAPIDWTPTKKYICLLGISHAMMYLHAKNIIHRDLKAENILLDINYFPKVCDFGLARCFPEIYTNSVNLVKTYGIGTPIYMSPELLNGDPYENDVDVYAFGMLAYEIITGKQAYNELGAITVFKLFSYVIKGNRPKKDECISDKMFELIEQCWNQSPAERPTFEEIFNILKSDRENTLFRETVDIDDVNDYLAELATWEEKNQQKEKKKNAKYDKIMQEKKDLENKIQILEHENSVKDDKIGELTEKNKDLEDKISDTEYKINLCIARETENDGKMNNMIRKYRYLEGQLNDSEKETKISKKTSNV